MFVLCSLVVWHILGCETVLCLTFIIGFYSNMKLEEFKYSLCLCFSKLSFLYGTSTILVGDMVTFFSIKLLTWEFSLIKYFL